jgi:PIN domain nuclease of toxin-antitoxin system
MRLLLDTHAFLWFVLSDPNLSAAARTLILDPNNTLLLSAASFWELAIKLSIGKYTLPVAYDVFIARELQKHGIDILPIEVAHAAGVVTLPFHHRDPFDRMLAAQCLSEKIPLVSADAIFDAYGVTRLW